MPIRRGNEEHERLRFVNAFKFVLSSIEILFNSNRAHKTALSKNVRRRHVSRRYEKACLSRKGIDKRTRSFKRTNYRVYVIVL